MANASLARAPVLLIGGCTSRPAGQHGAAAGHPARRHPAAGDPRLAHRPRRRAGGARARRGGGARHGRPGRARAGLCRDPDRRAAHARCPRSWCSTTGCAPKPPRACSPDPAAVAAAVEAFWSARRPLVITGRGARRRRRRSWSACSTPAGAVYLDTQESRGLVPADHPSFVGAVRAAAMTEADVVLVIGRKLDYQLGYGSPAVFPNARFVRIADNAGRADRQPPRRARNSWPRPALALAAMVEAAGNRAARRSTRPGPRDCAAGIASGRARRRVRRDRRGSDGKIHPARIFDAIARGRRPRLHRASPTAATS